MKKFLLAAFILFRVSANAQAPTNGLIAYFPFNGNSINNGSANISATLNSISNTTNNLGVANSAIQFAGNLNSYVEFTDNGNLDFSGTNDFAICIAFNFTGSSTGGLFDNCLNYGGPGLWLWSTVPNTWNLQGNYKNSSVGSATGTSFTPNQWNHAVFLRNNGIISIYINGVFKLSASEGSLSPTFPISPICGAMGYGGFTPPRYNPYSGKMDELRIYNRALSAAEITAVYNDYLAGGVQPVTITCPSNITVPNDAGQCGAIVNYPAATATGTPAPSISYSKASGTFFSVGTTTVTATATNGTASSASCSFTVTVTGGVDTDADAIPDVCDTDDDSDHIPDESDCAPLDPTKWQQALLYIDNDNDGYANGQQTVCYGSTIPTGYKASSLGTDCNDNNGSVWQSASLYIDNDNDGYTNGQQTVCYGATIPTGYKASSLGSDCNDNNAAVHPGATEICNDIDDDCDGSVDEGFINTVVTCPFTGTVTKNLQTGCVYTVNGNEFNATVSQNCGPLGYSLTGATIGTGVSLANVQFNTGTTTVTWSATNANDQAFTCSFIVSVVPAPPAIVCPANIVVPATNGQCSAVVNYTAPEGSEFCSNQVQPGSQTFNHSGAAQTFVVPNGVTSIKIKAWGAQGGNTLFPCAYTSIQNDGGPGGYAEGNLVVTPGQVLQINVGGQPANPINNNNFNVVYPGGFNGGGTGGYYGNAGGGASDVRINSYLLSDRKIVAGGGGGGNSGCTDHGSGGNGGGLTGSNGLSFNGFNPGLGGTQAAGGASANGGTAAGLGVGGNAAVGNPYHFAGGGGGYYGGGSAFASGGGGGSSYINGVTDGLTTNGVQTGHGKIIISWLSNIQPSATQTSGLPSGASFPVGTTTNTFLITDAFGQTSSCSFTVTVTDVQKPTFTCPNNQDVNLNPACQLIVPDLITGLTGSDNCGTVTFTQSPLAGASLSSSHNQSHNVLITASDGNGNIQTCSVVLTGRDVTKPTFICPSSQNVDLNATCQLLVPNLIAGLTGSDNCGSVTFTQSPLAGASLSSSNNQTHSVLITASDGNGNTQTCSVLLTGKDVIAPVINCLAPIVVNTDNNACGAIVNYGNNNSIQFSQQFVQGQASPHCISWKNFRSQLLASYNYTKVTIKGSLDPIGVSVTNPALVLQLANALRTGTSTTIVDNGRTWMTGSCGFDNIGQPAIEISAAGSICQCPGSQYIVRPCIDVNSGNPNWGGAGTNTCFGPSQTLTVVFEIAGSSGGVTATDNCSIPSVAQISGLSSGALFPVGTTTNTFIATDAAGNTSTCSFTVTVNDNQSPTFNCPSPQNVNLNGTCQLVVPDLITGLTGNDNCGTVTFTQSPVAGASLASSHNQTHNVLITASDGNGNTQTCTVVLTGKDVTKPTFTCPDNQNVNLNGTCQLIVPNLIAELTGNDNCGTITFTQSPVAGASVASSHNQTHNVVITANDGNGNTQTCTVILTGKDVAKPTFTCPDNQNVNLNGTCQLIVPNLIAELTGSDNCGTITFTQSPVAGASLASSHNQTHNVVITANDGNGNTQTCTIMLTGKDVTKPTFTCPDNQNVNLNGSCQLPVPNLIAGLTGGDNCGTVTFTQSPVAGASLASSHNQTHNVVITASDGNGNTQTCTVVLTGKDVTKPTFTCPDNQNVNLNGTCQLIVPNLIAELTGNDNCGTVTFAQSPLAGASLASSHNQTHNILITASDGNGNTQTCTVVLTGKDVTKPTFTCPYNQNVNLNGTCQLIVPNLIAGLTGNDNCGTVTFTQSPVAGASLASSHNQTHNVLITASDGNGNTQTCTVVLTGKDVTKPTFTCPYNQNVNLNGTCQLIVPNLIAGLTGNDNCGTVTFTQSPVAGASFASSHNQTHNVVITANDGNGNTESCMVVLTAKDITPPVITCPSPKTINCDASILPANTGSATSSDNCGGNPLITYSDVSGQDPNPSHAAYYNYPITRTWKATDVATNASTCNQTITVQDIAKPMITCPADKLSIPFDFGQLYATITIGAATATDNCAANPNITIAGTRSDNVAINNLQYPLGTTTVSWSATDPSSNSIGCTQTVTVRKRNTAVIYTGDMVDSKIGVQYSDIINLQAKLTDNEGVPTNNIGGRTITFQLLSGTTVLRSKTAITNTSGVAIDTFKIEQAPGMYSVKTIFAGDAYFNGSNDQDNCEVKQEDVIVEYNGSQYFTTASSTTLVGSITLAASLNDIDDGSDKRGDIRKAKATFKDGGPAGTVLGSANLPVGLVNPGVLTNGLSATTQNNITLNSNDASSGGKILQVWVGASDHYTGADAGPTPVTLALPGQDFVTGGGHLVVTNSAGTYAGTLNSKMNFGFAMKWNKSGKNLQGNINIVFRKWQLYNGVWQWRVYQAKSNAINSMAVVEVGANGQPVSGTNPAAFRKAIINTKANLKDVTDPLNNIDLGGNHNLTLDAWDHITANGGVSDKISVTLMGSTTNELLFSSSWISNATAAQTITGGNINVRNGSSSSSTSINTITKSNQMEATVKEDVFVVRAYPNPTNHQFTLTISSNSNEAIIIQVYDAAGRKIQTLNATADETIRFGEKLKAGIYIAQVIQGIKRESIKLIKQ